jgi:hypothetical protein
MKNSAHSHYKLLSEKSAPILDNEPRVDYRLGAAQKKQQEQAAKGETIAPPLT